MDSELEQRIRERAYAMWVDAGRSDGDGEKFWHAAAAELTGEQASEPSTPYGEGGGQKEPTVQASDGQEPSTPYVKD